MFIQISYQLIEYNVVCLLMISPSKHEATFYYQVLTNTGFWWSGWQILMLLLGWQKHLNTKAGNLKWSWLIYIAKEICIRIIFSLEKKRNFYILVFFLQSLLIITNAKSRISKFGKSNRVIILFKRGTLSMISVWIIHINP